MENNPEHNLLTPHNEHLSEAQEAAGKQAAEVLKSVENSVETSPETQVERAHEARKEAHEALLSREAGGAEKRRGGEPTATGVLHASKKQRAESYKAVMKQIQSEMSAPARVFSKIIHDPGVERFSDAMASSAARPNAVLAGSMAATFMTLLVFLIAKQYGYRLSGFETIGTFFVGWAFGLIYDYAQLIRTAKRR